MDTNNIEVKMGITACISMKKVFTINLSKKPNYLKK